MKRARWASLCLVALSACTGVVDGRPRTHAASEHDRDAEDRDMGDHDVDVDQDADVDDRDADRQDQDADPGDGCSVDDCGCAEDACDAPLRVGPTQHYLVTAAGVPFQLRGDSPWTITVQLTREEVTTYLDDRQAKGFNAMLVETIESKFGDAAPANAYGDTPFDDGDFTAPNEAYWEHVDYIVDEAAARGIVVLMCGLYLGWGGGDEGWYAAAVAAGAEAITDYGAFLGARYRSADNLIWVNGGDYRPPTLAIPDAFAAGILSQDTRHLITSHWARNSTGTDGSPSWLTLNSSYTQQDNVSSRVLADFQALPTLPTFVIEAHYEGSFQSSPTLTAADVRQEAWHAYLSGASGNTFGHHVIWQFATGWEAALDSPGATSMAHLHAFFGALDWWRLEPDAASTMVTAGRGSIGTTTYVAAARATDGTLGVAYIPDGRQITVSLASFRAAVNAQWFDPSVGTYVTVSGAPFANVGSHDFDPPGTADAVLLLGAP